MSELRGRVFLLARICARCGARNKSRTVAIAIAAALSIVVVAGAVAVLRGQWLPAGAELRPAVSTPSASSDDFGWLSAAMAECDAEAAKAANTLEFLVIPLKSTPGDAELWRKKSLNDIGNAILLTADDMLDGLKSGTLSVRASNISSAFAMKRPASFSNGALPSASRNS